MLLFGWSFLEGVGAALILPAIVALVAGNFPTERRPAAYGLVAAAGAVAVAVGPLIGGFCTTYFSWRWVFAGEVVVVAGILLLTRRIADAPVEKRPKLDVVGAVLSALGLGLVVFGVLRTSEWGWIQPKPDGPSWANLSPTVWLVLAGLFVIWLFFRWQARRQATGAEPLIRPEMLRNKQLSGGLIMFFFQFLAQAGLFFVVPLYLTVCLGLSALATGARLLPLSVTLLLAAIGIPKVLPNVSPRLVVRVGLLSLLAGTLVLLGGLESDSGPEIVFVPMLLVGLGIGALASQLGAVTVSAVPDEDSPEVGGIQNTMTNLGASLGTAVAGSILIGAVALSFSTNIQQSPDYSCPREVGGAREDRVRRPLRLRRRSGERPRRGGRVLGPDGCRADGLPGRASRRPAVRARGSGAADPRGALRRAAHPHDPARRRTRYRIGELTQTGQARRSPVRRTSRPWTLATYSRRPFSSNCPTWRALHGSPPSSERSGRSP